MTGWSKLNRESSVAREGGDLEAGKKQSERVHPNLNTMILMWLTQQLKRIQLLPSWKKGKMNVWASTQSPFGLQDAIVNELKMTRETVRVRTPFVGGGFGGKAAYQQGVEAARLAKLTGKPVMLVWTRDEEFFYDTFHSANVIKVNSGIDKSGMITFWDYHVWFAGTRGVRYHL